VLLLVFVFQFEESMNLLIFDFLFEESCCFFCFTICRFRLFVFVSLFEESGCLLCMNIEDIVWLLGLFHISPFVYVVGLSDVMVSNSMQAHKKKKMDTDLSQPLDYYDLYNPF
jgi:hypothetical protein